MYTLEEHLMSRKDQDSETLSTIWKQNKSMLPSAQNAISFNFPHYSLHDKSHSDKIIKI